MSIFFKSILISMVLFCDNHIQETSIMSPFKIYEANLSKAKLQNKKVLIIFGANWCIDCRALETVLNNSENLKFLNQYYILQKVDVGEFNKNLDFGKKFNRDIGELGIPNLVIVNQQEKILNQKIENDLSTASKLTSNKWKTFLIKYSNL